jgi:hypothetical protein
LRRFEQTDSLSSFQKEEAIWLPTFDEPEPGGRRKSWLRGRSIMAMESIRPLRDGRPLPEQYLWGDPYERLDRTPDRPVWPCGAIDGGSSADGLVWFSLAKVQPHEAIDELCHLALLAGTSDQDEPPLLTERLM